MSVHSDASFDESKEIAILKLLLENKKSIKTFFGENDKTPNHDGFFELVNTDTKQPTKQFVVQIKKGDVLRVNKDGSRSYSFDTAFLYYVKKRVTENPAIVFIIELNTGKCFYKYLSDEYLRGLHFENKDHVTLRLNDKDQIEDIDRFYQELCKIIAERNFKVENQAIVKRSDPMRTQKEKAGLTTIGKATANKSLFAFVFFATGWGPTEGGINAVNFDLCNAMGDISEEKHSDVYCIFSGAVPREQEKAKAREHNVTLIHVNEEDFKACKFDEDFKQIPIDRYEIVYWVGHDIISGKQALACKDKCGGKSVVFNHMHYRAYYGVARSTDACKQKYNEQREIFGETDYAIAIGPQLFESLTKNLVGGAKHPPKCEKVIPGLADIEPIDETITNPMTVLFTGRLEKENDLVKQYTVPLLAVSDLVKECSYTTNDIAIELIGLKGENVDAQAEDLKKQAKKRAGRVVNVLPLQYTASREDLFDTIKRSIVTVMPSLSEGFGLVGYESIAAGVPTIISKNSGLYMFLKDIGLESSVYGIDTGKGNQDVQVVKEFIKSIVTFLSDSKKRAIELRGELIKKGYTWKKTAEDTYSFLLPEISELSSSLKEMISDKASLFLKENVSDDYVLATAISHANQLAEEFAKQVEVDKQNVLSRSIDNLYSVQNGYNRARHEQQILDFIQKFLGKIVQALKENGASEEILKNFTDNNCPILTYKPNKNDDSIEEGITTSNQENFKKNFKMKTMEIIASLKRDAVVTGDEEEGLNVYHKMLLENPKYNTIDFRGVAAVISDDPMKSRANLKDIYVPIELGVDRSNDLLFDISVRDFFNVHDFLADRHFFENCDRLIIVGDPGSGKSIYLKNKLLEHCVSDSKRMCVFIKVAEFSGSIDVAAESTHENLLEKYIKIMLNKMPGVGTFYNTYTKFKDIGCVDYYIDGLDEVQDTQKKESANAAIIDFIDKSNGCKFFMTSRKIGLDTQLFKAEGFEVQEIAPLSKRSIEQYIENWYNFIATINKKDYEDRKEKLMKAIQQDEALNTLAKNPLLLSIIAIIHYHGKQLPKNKAALYKTITETLLQNWIEHKNLTVLKGLQNLDNQDLTNVFSRAAYWMIEDNYGKMAIGEYRLGTIYDDYRTVRKKGRQTPSSKRLLEYISQDAGIVVDAGKDDGERLYRFLMHRQFAEYYAAMELDHKLSANDKKLADILSEPKWTEVSILLCDHLHGSGESGDIKVQSYITELFNTKSTPIEDFYTNIQLILKWIINGVVLTEEIMQQLFKRLNKIFRSQNRFRVIQFSEDIIKAFADANNTWYQEEFHNFIKHLIDSEEYTAIRNAAVLLNLLLQDERYQNNLKEIGDEYIIKALKPIIENKDFYMLTKDRCYYALFIKKYVACVNQYFDSASDKNVWIDYTAKYAFNKKNSEDQDIEKLLQNEAELIKHDIIRDEFVNSVIFWSAATDIVKNGSDFDAANLSIDMGRWGCRSMMDSAKSIKNDTGIGEFCSNYSISHARFYHRKDKDEGKHIFTMFCYNREEKIVEKHQISLPYKFSLEDLSEQIKKENIASYLNEYAYLDELKDPEMTKEELKVLFDQAYANDVLLTGKAWRQLVIDKIAEDGEVFYKYFSRIKRTIDSYEKLDISGLKGEAQIYFRHLFSRRKSMWGSLFDDFDTTHKEEAIKSVGIEDKQLIIELYNNTEDEEHKAVLYEILYNLGNIE